MIEFRLPSLGADMDEGTLLEWHIQPGDAVKRGQVVALVDTAKAAVDVECWDEGTVDELIVQPGTKVPVGTVLALLRSPEESAERAAQWKSAHRPPQPGAAAGPVPRPPPPPGGPAAAPAAERPATPAAAPAVARPKASPLARRRAAELGVDLSRVNASGADGAVTIEDVERAAAAPPVAPPVEAAPPAAAPPGAPAHDAAAAQRARERAAEMRRTIAAAMARSKREIPHYYLATEVPFATATAWLNRQNEGRPVTERLLPAVVLIKAVAVALARYPELNGFWRDGRHEPAAAVHVGVAISLRQGGLAAPALLDVPGKTLDQLMRELSDLVRRTRVFSLKSSELAMPTVTVTNLGDQGVETVFGVIYPPQVAIVGFGRITERAWAADGALHIGPVVTASLAADHRASDGHRGALFLAELKALLQEPEHL